MSIDRIRDWRCDDANSGEDLAEKIREYHIPGLVAVASKVTRHDGIVPTGVDRGSNLAPGVLACTPLAIVVSSWN